MVLFRCDQCTYEEWREATQEPWLCPVCGWMRWTAIATDEAAEPSNGGAPDDPDSP
jgi:hypothetical protein